MASNAEYTVKGIPNRHTTMGNGKAKCSRRRREKRNNVKLENENEAVLEAHNVKHEESGAKGSETDRGKAIVAALCLAKGIPVLRKVVKSMLKKIIETWETLYGFVFRAMGKKRGNVFQFFQDFGVVQLLVDRLVGLVIHAPMKLIRFWYSHDTVKAEDWTTSEWKKGLVLPLPHGRLMLDVSMGWMRSRNKTEDKALAIAAGKLEENDRSIGERHLDCEMHEECKEGVFDALGEYSKIASSPGPDSKKAAMKSNVEEDRILAVRKIE